MRIAFTPTLAAGVEHALQKVSGVLAPASVFMSAFYDPDGYLTNRSIKGSGIGMWPRFAWLPRHIC